MAFPTTGILDDFNRANQGPPPSANWNPTGSINAPGGNALKVVSNACVGNGVSASGWWAASQFGPDCECYVTFPTVDATTNRRVYVRVQSPGSAAYDGYVAYSYSSGIDIYRIDNQVFTQLGSTVVVVLANGDSLGLEAIGTNITAYAKQAGVWSAVSPQSDPTYSTGYIAMELGSTSVVADDFGGGTVVAFVDTGLAWIRA